MKGLLAWIAVELTVIAVIACLALLHWLQVQP